MGCDYSVNVGPVVHIKNPPVETTIKHKGCCNNKCKKFHLTSYYKFCPDCGATVQEWAEPATKSLDINFYELFGDDDKLVPANHELSDAATIVLVSNKRVKGFEHFDFDDGDFEVFPKIEEITEYIENFKKVFANEILKLKEIFGESNVEVRYGTVGTISC